MHALQTIFCDMQLGLKSASTEALTNSFGWTKEDCQKQNDLHEFSRTLFELIETELKGTQVQYLLSDLYQGHIKSFIRCTQIAFESAKVDPYSDVQLTVKGVGNVVDSLKSYTTPELLTEDNMYTVENFGKQEAMKGNTFVSFPPVLLLQLLRFEYDMFLNSLVKLNSRFEFPEVLNLDEFLVDSDPDDPATYILQAVVVHCGSADNDDGHYVAYVSPEADEKWIQCNDSAVSPSSRQEALDGQFGGNSDRSAYFLQYIRISQLSSVLVPVGDEDIPDRLRKEHSEKENIPKQVEIAFYNTEVPSDSGFILTLASNLTYHEIVAALSYHIKLEPQLLRLYRSPTRGPLKRSYDGQLKDLFLKIDSKSNKQQRLYYRIIKTVPVRDRTQLDVRRGVVPSTVPTEMDLEHGALKTLRQSENDLIRFIYLMGLLERNEKLFYRMVNDNFELTMPFIDTPTAGLACLKYGLVIMNQLGLYVPISCIGRVSEVIGKWPEILVKVVVVTDGERILGVGDLGVNAMAIPVAKHCLYTACVGVKPQHCLPIILDVGTNNQDLVNDPLYRGLRQTRVTGKQYDSFLDEFMTSVTERFGKHAVIQFEGFANHNSFRLLEKYENQFCTFNSEMQGIAAVAVAGLLSCGKVTGRELFDNTFLFQGAGQAALAIAELLVTTLQAEGKSRQEALQKIWMVDSKGLIVQNRLKGCLTPLKAKFAHDHPPCETLEDAIKLIRPSVIFGVSAISGAFSESILQLMASLNETPVIFALSNPTSNAECTAELAYTITQGRCVFVSGSPSPPVTINERTFITSQANNAYIFPGVGLAAALCEVNNITEGMFLAAAQSLSRMVSEEEMGQGLVFPPLTKLREVSIQLAVDLAEYVFVKKLTTYSPEPEDKNAFIRSQLSFADF